MSSTIQIGLARAEITPPVGIPMVGFAGRGHSTEVHDALFATAMAVANGDYRAILISSDLLQFRADTVASFREAIESATGIPFERITLACTHNHYGPDVDRSTDSALVNAYRENLKYLLAGVAREALQDLVPARLSVGWGTSDIGVNRREKRPDGQIVLGQNPDGPVDRTVGVARFEDEEGRPIACLINFACHPVCQSGRMQSLSADFPGSMREVVEFLIGVPCVYLQGACGNINPIRMEHAHEPARSLGVRLGCEAARIWETISSTKEITDLKVASTQVSLPRYMYDTLDHAAKLSGELTSQVERLQASGGSEGTLWWAKLRLSRVNEAIESWKSGRPLPEVSAELQAWRIGDLAFATAPAEIFTENGALVKQQSPFKNTFFVGYTNGSIGYVPTHEAYPEGGYEVTHACQVDPPAGDIINEGCLSLLNSLPSE
jgi:hypothetical protein